MTYSDADRNAGLRDGLVAAGVHLVAARGVQALTLREIARATGVSHGAPRRYFPTHASLLSAIAHEGFVERVGRAASRGQPPRNHGTR